MPLILSGIFIIQNYRLKMCLICEQSGLYSTHKWIVSFYINH